MCAPEAIFPISHYPSMCYTTWFLSCIVPITYSIFALYERLGEIEDTHCEIYWTGTSYNLLYDSGISQLEGESATSFSQANGHEKVY